MAAVISGSLFFIISIFTCWTQWIEESFVTQMKVNKFLIELKLSQSLKERKTLSLLCDCFALESPMLMSAE